MIRKDWSFYGQILQVVAVLDKNLIFSDFSYSFF